MTNHIEFPYKIQVLPTHHDESIYLSWIDHSIWCKKHFDRKSFEHGERGQFWFKNEQDALLFALRWS